MKTIAQVNQGAPIPVIWRSWRAHVKSQITVFIVFGFLTICFVGAPVCASPPEELSTGSSDGMGWDWCQIANDLGEDWYGEVLPTYQRLVREKDEAWARFFAAVEAWREILRETADVWESLWGTEPWTSASPPNVIEELEFRRDYNIELGNTEKAAQIEAYLETLRPLCLRWEQLHTKYDEAAGSMYDYLDTVYSEALASLEHAREQCPLEVWLPLEGQHVSRSAKEELQRREWRRPLEKQMMNPMGTGDNSPQLQGDPVFPYTPPAHDSDQTAEPATDTSTETAEVKQESDDVTDIDPRVRAEMQRRPHQKRNYPGSRRFNPGQLPTTNTGNETRVTPRN